MTTSQASMSAYTTPARRGNTDCQCCCRQRVPMEGAWGDQCTYFVPKPEVWVVSPSVCILMGKKGVKSPEQGSMAGSFQLWNVCVPSGSLLPRGRGGVRASHFHLRRVTGPCCRKSCTRGWKSRERFGSSQVALGGFGSLKMFCFHSLN